MPRSCLLLVLAALVASVPLQAQRARFGFAVGKGFVGNADSKTLAVVNGDSVAGGDQAGLHWQAFVEVPLSSPSFAFRGELFYNRITSHSNSFSIVNGSIGKAALEDRTIGLVGSFIATVAPKAGVSPYFLLGAGMFQSKLGTNPDPQSSQVVNTAYGLGLGLQTGMGLRVRMGKRNLLFELGYRQALNNTRGAAFMPLSVGLTF